MRVNQPGASILSAFGRSVVLDQPLNLLQCQPQLLHCQNTVQVRQLRGAIVAIARKPVCMFRLKQANLIALSQLLIRRVRDIANFATFKHR